MLYNEPTEFPLNRNNALEILMEWLPEQLHKMRLYESAGIDITRTINGCASREVFLTYMQTIGGEKFRLGMGSHNEQQFTVEYFPPLSADDDIVLGLGRLIEKEFSRIERINSLMKKTSPVEVTMEFLPSPFDHPAIIATLAGKGE